MDYMRSWPSKTVVAGPVSVGRQSVAWAWATLAVSLLMWPVTPGIGWIYTAAAVVLGTWYVVEAHQWLGRIRSAATDRPMRLFSVSITHLTLLSIALVVDVLV